MQSIIGASARAARKAAMKAVMTSPAKIRANRRIARRHRPRGAGAGRAGARGRGRRAGAADRDAGRRGAARSGAARARLPHRRDDRRSAPRATRQTPARRRAAGRSARRRPLRELARLDRYERRVRSRRRTAVRALQAARPIWQNQPGKPNDINTHPEPSTTTGKGCVPPRDPVGSPLMVRSAAARLRVSNHDHIPNHKTHPSELTPHGEVET